MLEDVDDLPLSPEDLAALEALTGSQENPGAAANIETAKPTAKRYWPLTSNEPPSPK